MRLRYLLKRLCLIMFSIACCLMLGGILLHVCLFDGLDNAIFSVMLEDTTVYAPNYSEQAFQTIRPGMREDDVLTILGTPLDEGWYYYDASKIKQDYRLDFDADGFVSHSDKLFPIQKGMTKNQIIALLGEPSEKSWRYSWSPTSGSYWLRVILFKAGHVTEISHEFYVD